MSRTAKRLLVALCLSSGCYYGTVYWYKHASTGLSSNVERKHIATLLNHENEVQRKPLARVIWESITDGDALFAGESIRTTDSAEAKIKFNSGALIELEPDSLIVLEENDDGIAIDYLRGNLLVKGGKGGKAGGLKLKSGKSSIDLSNADLSLSKSSKGAVDLQLLGGNATITQDGKTLNFAEGGTLTDKGIQKAKNLIQVIYPIPGEPVYVNPRKKEPVVFQWKKLPKGYTVFLERGKKRGKLRRYKRAQARGEDGELKARFKIGKYYWRLVAEPDEPNLNALEVMKSRTVPSQILAKSPPILIEPLDKAQVVIKQDDPKFRIKWANKTKVDNIIVQMATDPQFKKGVLEKEQQTLDPALDFKDISLKKSGKFYWRIVTYMKVRGKTVPLSSEIRSFYLQVGVNLVPPKLRSPMAKQRFSYNQVVTSGLFLTWDPVPGIEEYMVDIKRLRKRKTKDGKSKWSKKEFLSRKVTTSPLKFSNFKPGRYEWVVYSLDKDGKKSKPSEKRRFKVDKIPRVYFVDGPDPTEYLYFTKTPQIYAAWKKSEGITQWRVRYATDGELSDETPG